MVQMQWNLISRLRRFFRWLWSQEGTPGYRARGLAIGVFCGCFPLFGFQTLLGITLARLLRGNQFLAVSGTWISNPLTYVPLYWFNYRVGCTLLGHRPGLHEFTQFGWSEIWDQGSIVISRLLLGSALTGTICGLLIGLLVYLQLKLRS